MPLNNMFKGLQQTLEDSNKGPFSNIPVSGLNVENGLFVIYTPDNRYVRPSETVLQLKEKYTGWTADDSIIKDNNGMKWFTISGNKSSFGTPTTRALTDPNGQELAEYQLNTKNSHGTAFITMQTSSGRYIVATIKESKSFRQNVDIFVHNPMMSLENPATTEGLAPTIRVQGDVMGKNFDFMKDMGIVEGNQLSCKIAKVKRKYGSNSSYYPNTYFLQIGTNADIAFICMCTYAIDEMFFDDEERRLTGSRAVVQPARVELGVSH